jgi:ribosomal protein S18 acetylase RimI-like enzyme
MSTLRRAQPDASDAQAFAKLYRMATINMMEGYLGPQAYQILARLFLLPNHEHSYDLTTFAIEDGAPAGLLMGYTTEEHERMGGRTLMLYARYGFFGLLRGIPMILNMRPLRAVTATMPPNAYCIKGIAVDPAHRRKGIAAQLMQHAEDLARQADCTQMVLDVRTMNEGAIAFYEACGYQKAAQTPTVTYKGEDYGFYRMEKTL